MAEPRQGGEKSSKILSFAKKKTRRVQQKMMEKVGKSERTLDDNYTEFVVNFNKQQLAAARLQKELSRYTNSVKALKQNTKLLLDLWLEYYEPEWTGHDEIKETIQHKYLLWDDLITNISSQMLEPLQHYISKFPETKKLIEKRERKVVDYDYAKRELEAIRQKQKSTPDKIQHAEDTFHQAKTAFDEVTDILYNELPTLYDSRIDFYSTFFCNMSSMDTTFHEEMTRLDRSFNEHMNDLHKMSEEGVYSCARRERPRTDSTSHSTKEVVDDESVTDEVERDDTESYASAQGGDSEANTPPSHSEKHTPTKPPPSKPPRHDSSSQEDTNQDEEMTKTTPTDDNPSEAVEDVAAESKSPPIIQVDEISKDQPDEETIEENHVTENEEVIPENSAKEIEEGKVEEEEVEKEENSSDEVSNEVPNPEPQDSIPKPQDPEPHTTAEANSTDASVSNGVSADNEKEEASKTNTGPTILYKVWAAHTYTGEDEDELTFEKGEMICIIPFDDPDDEEEGWKMGWIEGTDRRGLFPENFTKPL